VQECLDSILENPNGEPGEYELCYHTWSNEIPHRFDAKARGFKLAEPTNG